MDFNKNYRTLKWNKNDGIMDGSNMFNTVVITELQFRNKSKKVFVWQDPRVHNSTCK